jgi:dihydroorotase
MIRHGRATSWEEGGIDLDLAYDVIVKGGLVFDSAGRTLNASDVGFRGGRVQSIQPSIDPAQARATVDASGAIVAPGLVDVHAHVFDCIGDSVDPDVDCLPRGTTTVVDGGSAGANSFKAFVRLTGDKRINVLAWLNLSTIGQIDTRVGELFAMPHADVGRAVATIEKYPERIVGLKARLSTYVVGGSALPVLTLLRACADEVNLPIMVHIGDTGEPLGGILPYLRAGDVVTHMMTGRKNGIVDASGTIRPEVREARERGVLFDASRGMNHESFVTLRACMDQGFLPDTISTDLTKDTARNPAYGLLLMASHMLHFGMALPDILACMTSSAARMIGKPGLGSLTEGGAGDCTIIRVVDGPARFVDVDGRVEEGQRSLAVHAVIRDGEIVSTSPGSPD